MYNLFNGGAGGGGRQSEAHSAYSMCPSMRRIAIVEYRYRGCLPGPPMSRNLELLTLFFTLVWDVFYMSCRCCRGCTMNNLQRLWCLGWSLQSWICCRDCTQLYNMQRQMYFTLAGNAAEAVHICTLYIWTTCKICEVMDVFYMSWLGCRLQ